MDNIKQKYSKFLNQICKQYNFLDLLNSKNFFTTNDTFRALLDYLKKTFINVNDNIFDDLYLSLNLLYSSIVELDNIIDENQ